MAKELSALRKQWQITKTRWQVTWFWRVFGINAMQKKWTKLLVWVAIVTGVSSLYLYVYFFNPVLPLSQLTKREGILVHISQPLRTAHKSAFQILTDSGEELTYRADLYNKAAFHAVKGKRVTVWSQTYYSLWWPFYCERAREVQQGDQLLMNYLDLYKNTLHFRPRFEWLAKHLMILAALSLTIVTLSCYKDHRRQENGVTTEIILYENNSTVMSWLGAVVSITCTIFSLLLIAGALASSKPILGIWGWLLLWLIFLLTAMFSTIFIYSIPRSKYKVIWSKDERILKKIGKNVNQEICSKTSPIRLRAMKINTGKTYIEMLVAMDDHGEMTIASSGYNGNIERLIETILLATNGACIKEEG